MKFFTSKRLKLVLIYLIALIFLFRSDLIEFGKYINQPNSNSYQVVLNNSENRLEYCLHDNHDAVRYHRTVIRDIGQRGCVTIEIPEGAVNPITVTEYSTRLPPMTHFVFWILFGCLIFLPHKKIVAPLMILLYLGFSSRWTLLSNVIPTGTEPDAHSYLSLALTITGPLGTQSREPLFVLWLRPLVLVGNNPEFLNRIATISTSLLVIIAAYSVFYKKFGWKAAFLVGIFLATHPLSQNLSVRGMRDELISLLTLILINYLFVSFRNSFAHHLFLGMAAGLLALCRLETLTFSVVLVTIAIVLHRSNALRILVLCLPVIMMLTPYLLHNKRLYNDYFYPSTLHATWFRNYEFLQVKKTGCIGCPTLEEYPKDSAGGKRISSFQYLFSYHSIPEITNTSVVGLANLLLLRHNAIVFLGYENYLIHILYLMGLVYLLVSRKWLYLLLPLILVNALVFFLGVDGFLDIRILINILPFIGLIIYFGIVSIWRTLFWAYSVCWRL